MGLIRTFAVIIAVALRAYITGIRGTAPRAVSFLKLAQLLLTLEYLLQTVASVSRQSPVKWAFGEKHSSPRSVNKNIMEPSCNVNRTFVQAA